MFAKVSAMRLGRVVTVAAFATASLGDINPQVLSIEDAPHNKMLGNVRRQRLVMGGGTTSAGQHLLLDLVVNLEDHPNPRISETRRYIRERYDEMELCAQLGDGGNFCQITFPSLKVLYTKKDKFASKIEYDQDNNLPQPQKLNTGMPVMPVTDSRSGR